jgi:hypothetical protein
VWQSPSLAGRTGDCARRRCCWCAAATRRIGESLRPVVDAALPGAAYLPVISAIPGKQMASAVLGSLFGSGIWLNIAGKKP